MFALLADPGVETAVRRSLATAFVVVRSASNATTGSVLATLLCAVERYVAEIFEREFRRSAIVRLMFLADEITQRTGERPHEGAP
jgi:hypothetical protein